MPALCLCYEVHEPYQLRHYTVFDMGQNSIYEDDDRNIDVMLHTARVCYLPMNDLLLKMIRRYGKDFRLTFCISGTALDQFEQYAPEVLESFQALAATGNVEFAAETMPHSFAFLYSRDEFIRQVEEHAKRIKRLFGKKPTTYRNAELVYNNDLANCLAELGFKTVLAEGAEHVLGWRSSNFVYAPLNQPEMRLLMRNVSLSTDIGRRFNDHSWNEWPLTAEKFAGWIHALPEAQVINLFNDYHVFGLRMPASSGIFNFFEKLPEAVLSNPAYSFATCSEIAKKCKPAAEIDVPEFMSWDDSGRDLTAWLGNDMQKDAIHTLYAMTERIRALGNPDLLRDFERLQTTDHFHNMSTKWFTLYMPDRPNTYPSPYDAYIVYMNVVSDLEMRLKAAEEEQREKRHVHQSEKKLAEEVHREERKVAKKILKEEASEQKEKKSSARPRAKK